MGIIQSEAAEGGAVCSAAMGRLDSLRASKGQTPALASQGAGFALALLSSLDRVEIMGRVKPESGSGSEVHSHRDSVHLEQSHLFQL